MAHSKRKRGGKWIQEATDKMDAKGTKGSYGSHSAKQKKRDIAKGGAIGKKAQFAANMAKIRGGKRSRRK